MNYPLFLILSWVLSFAPALGAESVPEVRLGIKELLGDRAGSTVLVHLGFLDDPKAGKETRLAQTICRTDLTLSGLIQVSDIAESEKNQSRDPYLELKITKSPKDYLIRARLASGKETLLTKNIKANEANLRANIHALSDEILKTLTGEKGFFLTKVAFTLKKEGRKEIWVADWDGYNGRPLTEWNSTTLLASFSRDAKLLVFTSYKENNPDLYLFDFAKKSLRPLSRYQGLNSAAAFDPKGEGLAVTLSRGGEPNIYFVSLEGKILKRLTATRAIDTSPVFSPNGQEIAFTSDRSGNPQIYIMSRDGANSRRLSYGFAWADEADWSSDGQLIAFSGKKDINENFQIYLTDPLGLRFVSITSEGANEHPSFSPGGQLVVYSSNRNSKWEIFLQGVGVKTPEMRLISPEKAEVMEPSWSLAPPPL